MKTGDIVVCIDNKLLSAKIIHLAKHRDDKLNGNEKHSLTINKQYKVLEVWGNLWVPALLVQCDDGSQQHFRLNRFITLREYNLNKLKI